MGFGKSLKKIVGGAAAVGGAVFAGPVGGALGGALGARLAGVSVAKGALAGGGIGVALPALSAGLSSLGGTSALRSAGGAVLQRIGIPGLGGLTPAPGISIPDYGPMPAGAGMAAALPGAWPGGAGAMQVAAPMLGMPIAGAMPYLGAAGAAVARLGTRLWSQTMGRWVSGRTAAKYAKILGIQGAATILGVGVLELAQSVLTSQARRGRGRGITSAQMRTTIRTMGKVERLHARIAAAARTHVGRSSYGRGRGRGATHVRTAAVTHL